MSRKIIALLVFGLLFFSTTVALATEEEQNAKTTILENGAFLSEKMVSSPYEGRLRVYVTEPESRWEMADHKPYHYAVLDFAYDDVLSIDYLDTYEDTIIWSGNVDEDNVMVIAALFNLDANTGYAYPPFSNSFDAHYVDAAAGATPGNTGYNTVTEEFLLTLYLRKRVPQHGVHIVQTWPIN